MSSISHHIDDASLAAFASGQLSHPFAVVVSSHLAMCDTCRTRYDYQLGLAGSVLSNLPGSAISGDVKASVMDQLDTLPFDEPIRVNLPAPYPAPLSQFFGAEGPDWTSIGMSARQSILWSGPEGSVRLLHIPPGKPVPEHSHSGPEYTLVLQGNYQANGSLYAVGDVEIADEDVDHTPIAGPDMPCICLAATNAPLRFKSILARMVQPLLKI